MTSLPVCNSQVGHARNHQWDLACSQKASQRLEVPVCGVALSCGYCSLCEPILESRGMGLLL